MNEETKMHLQNSKEYLKQLQNEVEEAYKAIEDNKKLRIRAEQRENALRAYKSEMFANREEGIEEGEKSKAIEIARNALKTGLNNEQVVQLTGLLYCTPKVRQKI